MLVDVSVSYQKYVEDCEVCCNPMEVEVSCDGWEIVGFNVLSLEQ